MSGAEALALLGGISAIVAIVDATKKIYDTAHDARGLPKSFREVAARLPVVQNILRSSMQRLEDDAVGIESTRGLKDILWACEDKAKKLEGLFHRSIPKNGGSDVKRYYKAVKAYRKGGEVENLMKGILEDVQLLTCEQGTKTATSAQQAQIVQAVRDIASVIPSVPNQVTEIALPDVVPESSSPHNAQGEDVTQADALEHRLEIGAAFAGRSLAFHLAGKPRDPVENHLF